MKKIRLLPSFLMLVLCVVSLVVGAYALKPKKSNVQGTISISASNAEVEITAYLGANKTTKVSNTVSTRANSVVPIYEDVLSFNGSGKATASEVDAIILVLEIKNNSTEHELGAFFSQDETLPETITSSNITTSMGFDGASIDKKIVISDMVGVDLQGYTKIGISETVNVSCVFYLNALSDVDMKVNFDLPLVVHPYDESLDKQHWNSDSILKILSIGDSFAVDSQEYAYQIAQSLGVENVKLGNLCVDGSSLSTHLSNAQNDTAAYTYYTNTTGTWSSAENYKISTAVSSDNWDFITFQQAGGNSGQADTYDDLQSIIEIVKQLNDNARYVWNMTWAYQQDSTRSDFANYNNNQTTMYSAIVNAVQTKINTNVEIDRVIPVGTAIQNIRTSYIGDTLTRDGYNLSYDLGRYIGGLCFVHSITGKSIENIDYAPEGVSKEEKKIALESIRNAYKNSYRATQSNFDTVNTNAGYEQIDLGITEKAFYASLEYEGASSTYHYNLITEENALEEQQGLSIRYAATRKFSKEELPVGTIIEIAGDDFQYRPEGWINGAVNTTRPAIVAKRQVVIDESWWGNFTERAFNISMYGNPDITDKTLSSYYTAIKIYRPQSADIMTELSITWTKSGYYQSQGTINGAGPYDPQMIHTTQSNSVNFWATQIFTKAELPVGTIIEIADGWQYRPEGWVNKAANTTRPANVTTAQIIIDEAWWGSYTERAFNIAMVGNSTDISRYTEAQINQIFKIYIPA